MLDVKEKGWHGKDDAFLLRKAAKARRFIISHDHISWDTIRNSGRLPSTLARGGVGVEDLMR